MLLLALSVASVIASISQSIVVASAIVGTLGLTTLFISLYERHGIAKENKRQRFAKLVLTDELFAHLTACWRLHAIGNAALDIRKKGSGMLDIDGKICRFTDVTKLEVELDNLLNHVVSTMDRVKEGGPFFLAPPNVRQALGELGTFFEKINLREIDSGFLDSYGLKLNEIQKLMRKEVGLE